MLDNGPWADPRGAYAILALLVLAVLGATLAPGGLRSQPRRPHRLIAGAVLIGAALSLLWPTLTRRPALEVVASLDASRVAGVWIDGTDTLVLEQLGAYRCTGASCTGVGPRGTWSLVADSALVTRWSDGHEVPWRVVSYRGQDRLALAPLPAGGANWDGRLLFRRANQ